MKDARPKPEKRYRRCVAVDKTKVKVGREQIFVWAGRGVDTREVVAFRANFT